MYQPAAIDSWVEGARPWQRQNVCIFKGPIDMDETGPKQSAYLRTDQPSPFLSIIITSSRNLRDTRNLTKLFGL